MMGLLTSMPAKVGAAMAGGTALTGEPILGTALALGTPALATRAYLSPRMQRMYGNTMDPLFNYMGAPIDPMQQYLQSLGLVNTQLNQPNGAFGGDMYPAAAGLLGY
jgi:hypothetical protein